MPLVHDLRMKPKRDSNARGFSYKTAGTVPSPRCRGYGEHVGFLACEACQERIWIWIEIDVAMEIDHWTLAASRKALTSSRPLPATSMYFETFPSCAEFRAPAVQRSTP